ncbi:CAP domain-containing protein [Halomonas sp. TD01]|uniref:CAP domain-containing protein n=1 Tax=Halomonas sp. TD01 TaxID=999141 RepID=UPI000214EEBA|nr:CAP domain-containing protein [Halomonas sp. TD01]EGP21130.1 SCP/PR1 domain-containing protein [Halomonas sp. TD01]CAH1044040.1 Allergen V5/Tpx-1 related [Halomonas sp. TD01]
MKNSAANVTLKRPTHWALFSLVTLMLIGSGTWADDDSRADSTNSDSTNSDSANSECGLTDQQQEMLTRVNEARNNARQCGDQSFPAASPLTWSCKLEAAAAMHANDMAKNDYVSHSDPDGAGVEQRVNQQEYAWQAVGENIAAGHTSVAAVVNGWLESPSHCSNMMNDTFTEMGMAKADNADSRYTTFWAQVLGHPR